MRRSRFRSLLLSSFALAFTATVAAADSTAPAAVAPEDLALTIRAHNDEATRAAAARILAAAEGGNSIAMYDLGSLQRQSKRKGAAVASYDLDQAISWLTRAFDQGRITAAYKLSLAYAESGQPLEAMAWTQVFSYYTLHQRDPQGSEEPSSAHRNLVAAALKAAYERLDRSQEAAIRERTIALLEAHGPQFESNRGRVEPQHVGWALGADHCKFARPVKGSWVVSRTPTTGLVEFLVAVQPNGGAAEVVALDSAPEPMHERQLRALAQRVTCTDASDQTRYLFQNFTFHAGPRLELARN